MTSTAWISLVCSDLSDSGFGKHNRINVKNAALYNHTKRRARGLYTKSACPKVESDELKTHLIDLVMKGDIDGDASEALAEAIKGWVASDCPELGKGTCSAASEAIGCCCHNHQLFCVHSDSAFEPTKTDADLCSSSGADNPFRTTLVSLLS